MTINTALILEKNFFFSRNIEKIYNFKLKKKKIKKEIFYNIKSFKKKTKFDYVFNFGSAIFPQKLLNKIKYPINFHPGPRDLPGRGCYSWALYKNKKKYGCVAHIMNNDVDSGKIICERKFIIQNNDNIESLKFKSYLKILEIFYEILIQLNNGHALKFSKLKWSRKPYKISDLDKVNFYHYGESKKKIKHVHRSFDYYPYSPYCIKGEKKIKVKIKKVKNLI